MKAGRAGSIPDGVTSRVDQSAPLDQLLDDIGGAVSCLNTIVVGLDAVEEGHQKPAELNISWNPEDREAAARKSRHFALEATLVRVAEGLQQYILAISQLPRFSDLRKEWTGDTSAAEKLRQITESIFTNDYLVVAAILLVHWRNRVVHTNSRATLTRPQKTILRDNENEIFEKYQKLSIDRLLSHFEEQRPTLKDVSCLIAMSIRLMRNMDKTITSELSREDLDAWLAYYGLTTTLAKVRRETSPSKLDASLRRALASVNPKLADLYFKYYTALGEPYDMIAA